MSPSPSDICGCEFSRDTCERAARLTLAARDEDQEIVVRNRAGLVLRHERGHALEIAAFAGGGFEVAQAAADEGHAAAGVPGGVRDGFNARHVARETGHGHPAPHVADQGAQALPHFRLGARMALHHRVGGIADHRQHPLLAEPPEGSLVGGRADKRLGVELEVARVQDGAVRGADDQRLGFGDRVGHAHELQGKWRQVDLAPGRDHVQRHLPLQLRLAEFAPQHGGCERRRVNRAAQLRPKPGNRAHVVLMGMRDDQPYQAVPALRDEPRIGHHHVHLGVFGATEADPAIDGEPTAAAAVEIEIHADLARPAQGQEGQITACSVHSWFGRP